MIKGKCFPLIKIPDDLVKEALDYAIASREHTSDRHAFHEGGLEATQRKMYEGKLGEKIFKVFLLDNNIDFKEDDTPSDKADYYDFLMPGGVKLDVKTRTKDHHIRTLEMVEQLTNRPKDIYVSVRLFAEEKEGYIVGWSTRDDILSINRRQNHGYLLNYVLFDCELKPIEELINFVLDGEENA